MKSAQQWLFFIEAQLEDGRPAPNRVALFGTRRKYVHVGLRRASMASDGPCNLYSL